MQKKSSTVGTALLVTAGLAWLPGQTVLAEAPDTTVVAQAEDAGEFAFDEVVVTATRVRQDAKKIPASVTVVTAEDIKKMNIMTVDEALRNAVGIFVDRPKGISGVGDGVMMRGFSDNNVLVLLDGQPLNSAFAGAINWNAVPLENVERIEVVRGGASSLYGGRAVGGVIQIITKDPQKSEVTTNIGYGSDNTWRRSLALRQKVNDKFSFSLGYEGRSTDGIAAKPASSTAAPKNGSIPGDKPLATGAVITKTVDGKERYIFGTTGNNAYEGNTGWVKLKYHFDRAKELQYSYNRDSFEYRYDNPTTFMRDAAGKPVYSGYVALPGGKYTAFDQSHFTDNLGRRVSNIHGLRYYDAEQEMTLQIGLTDTTEDGYATSNYLDKSKPGSDSSYPNKTWNIDWQKVWRPDDKRILVAGVNWQHDTMDQTSAKLAHWGDYHSQTQVTALNGGKDRSLAFFVQNEQQMTPDWKLYTGLRYDCYTKYDGYSKELKSGGIDKTFAEDSFTELSPKVAIEHQADENTTYYASYAHSFNPPTLQKLYRWTTSTNYDSPASPGLKPERSDTLEIGMNKQFDKKTRLHMALYQTKTKDLITRVSYAAGTYLPSKEARLYENVDSATRKGVEMEVNHAMNANWDLFMNYAWQKGDIDNSQTTSGGMRISAIPEHLLHIGAKYHQGKWAANIDGTYVSERNDDGAFDGVFGASDAYFIVNTNLQYAIQPEMTLSFGVNNLFDRQYYSYYQAAGRTYHMNVQYRF